MTLEEFRNALRHGHLSPRSYGFSRFIGNTPYTFTLSQQYFISQQFTCYIKKDDTEEILTLEALDTYENAVQFMYKIYQELEYKELMISSSSYNKENNDFNPSTSENYYDS